MRVVIAHHTIFDGDAVGNDILNMAAALMEKGCSVKLRGEAFSNTIKRKLRASESYLRGADLLIYHHSIYWQGGEELFKCFQGKKILRYHSITPPHFFKPYSSYFNLTMKGRDQTVELVQFADSCLVDSRYNANEISALGFKKESIEVLPPFPQFKNFKNTKPSINIEKKLASTPGLKVLTVGRIAPNKGLLNVVKVAVVYKQLFGKPIEIYLVGPIDNSLASFNEILKRTIEALDISSSVHITNKVSLEELKAYYTNCDIYLCLSQHEGFCVPLIEAQYFRMPVVAYGLPAVLETLGPEQLIFDEIDHAKLAAALHVVNTNADYSKALIERGLQNLQRFETNTLRRRFWEMIEKVMRATT